MLSTAMISWPESQKSAASCRGSAAPAASRAIPRAKVGCMQAFGSPVIVLQGLNPWQAGPRPTNWLSAEFS